MATIKKRLNITLSPEMERAIAYLAEKESMPQARKISELLKLAIELEEDDLLNSLATDRDKKKDHYITHKTAWK
ncbi:MAG: hypothetical protein ACOCU8_03165 [Patescibacteria group bacterium]